jgi:type II secretory ATPase GspE/PulE/Tfp pilus assembly ATPase PilB-like protein
MGDAAASLLMDLLRSAIARGATSIHLDPDEAGLRVRLHVDGQLVEVTRVDGLQVAPVVGRLKNIAGMDQAQLGIPQVGQLCLAKPTRVVFRVSTHPTALGESFVLQRVT